MKRTLDFHSLKFRIPLLTGMLIFAALAVTSGLAVSSITNTIISDTRSELMYLADSHGEMIDRYLSERMADIKEVAEGDILTDPNASLQEKRKVLTELQRESGGIYYDVFLTDQSGKLLASSGTNNLSNYGDTSWFKNTAAADETYCEDFFSQELDSAIVSFSHPIKGERGELLGVAAARMSVKAFDDTLEGLQEELESRGRKGSYPYIINREGIVMWHPVEEKIGRENLADRQDDLGDAAQRMMSGEMGSSEYSYEGVDKIIGFAPMTGKSEFQGLGWSIAITLNRDVLMGPVKETALKLVGLGIIIIIASLVTLWLIVSKSLRPLTAVIDILREISQGKGDLTRRIVVESKDEAGQLGVYFNEFIEKIQNMMKDVYETTLTLNKSSDVLAQVSDTMAANSEEMNAKTESVMSAVEEIAASIDDMAAGSGETSSNINVIASAVEEMSASTRNLASASEQTSVSVEQIRSLMEQISGSIHRIASSSSEASGAVNSVATAVKEINISLNEVSSNCERSTQITGQAENRAKETNVMIEKLNKSSRQISKIINVINDIADQTNMLALNAAIEAAGAGEAGKGFAVVANEVKELAKQTAEATDEISLQIEDMQISMSDAVKSVESITKVIEEISDITSTIAAAVTEQSAITGEISGSVLQAAERVNTISEEISDVASHAQNAVNSIGEASKGVQEIARSASELSGASGEIAQSTEKASARVVGIASSAQEISRGTNDISLNMQEISMASAETATGATDTSSSAKQLAELAHKLDDLIKRFKI